MQNTQIAPQGAENETKDQVATDNRMKAYAEKIAIKINSTQNKGGNC